LRKDNIVCEMNFFAIVTFLQNDDRTQRNARVLPGRKRANLSSTRAFPISHFSSCFRHTPRLFLKRPCCVDFKCTGKDETSPRSKARRSKHNFFISVALHPVCALFPCLRLDVLAHTRKNCRPSGERHVTFLARGISFVRETLE